MAPSVAVPTTSGSTLGVLEEAVYRVDNLYIFTAKVPSQTRASEILPVNTQRYATSIVFGCGNYFAVDILAEHGVGVQPVLNFIWNQLYQMRAVRKREPNIGEGDPVRLLKMVLGTNHTLFGEQQPPGETNFDPLVRADVCEESILLATRRFDGPPRGH